MPALSIRNLMLATIFGVMIFIFETLLVLPRPLDKILTFFQAMLLSLGYLLLGIPGATFISLVGGSLTALLRLDLAPLTLAFALLYGVLIDTFSLVLRVKGEKDTVRQNRVVVAVTLSTLITGLAGYFSNIIFEFLPLNPTVGIVILVSGIISGIIGGYLSIIVWKKISGSSSTGLGQ